MIIELQRSDRLPSQNLRFKNKLSSSRISLLKRIRLMISKRKQRADLMKLDERLLKDIGKSLEEAEKEANRYFWQ